MSDDLHPSDDNDIEKVFNFPYLSDAVAVQFLNDHGRVFFIVRGLPGTGKSVLSTMLMERYPTHKIYWADKMFMTPVPIPRTPDTLRESHKLCHEKIEGFMQKNVPVIINRSTNVRVSEVSRYLLLGVKYGYTTILADTSYKFSIVPEELAATNTKRLNLDYMKKRCAQWQNVYPIYTGWFLCPSDALFLFKRFSHILDLLNKSGWSPPKVLHQEGQPFCLGRRCWFGIASTEKEYCDSKEVRDAYGSVHTLKVVGYAITHEFVVAMVMLDEGQARLLGHRDADDNDQSVSDLFSGLSVKDWQPTRCEVELSDVVEDDEDDQDEDTPITGGVENIVASDAVSFVILGSCSEDPKVPLSASKDLPGMWKALCEKMSISERGVMCEEKISVGDAVAYRAHQDYLILDKGAELEGVFTGYYQPYDTKIDQLCRNFARTGKCRFGNSCFFKHERTVTYVPATFE
ncbi:2',3'-cyclic-nucleotide 3'-phosphodiesterase-like [Ornithodoros turicata]|uniref:2',3'-cyclic-nucleotide 3'-phosphodiesterase-like n=1 Tax=Ornithodoros turicata TaxID=34597 RepID=UPI00313A31EA